jgi:hypothetical protein
MAAAPIFRGVFLAVLVSLLTVAVPGTAAADDQAAVNKVTALNKRALDAYQKQDYETARALLKEALELCASAGLDKHAIRARTHIHFGVVAIVGFKQREVGLKQFRKALDVQPDIKLTKSLATPELQDAFEEAVLAGESGGGGGAATAGGGGEPAGEGGGDGATAVADDDEGGNAKPTIKKPAPRKKKSDDDDKDEGDGQKGVLFVGLTGGFALGLVKGNGELDPNAHKLDAAGFATGQGVQVTPEFGLFISPELMLSLQGRFQYVSGLNGKAGMGCGPDNFCSPGSTAAAVFGKATYLLTSAPFRLTLGGQLGYGYIRHALGFPDPACKASATSPTTQSCVDTLAGGPLLVGPTIGFFYELGSSIDLIFAVNTALGVPNFTFNFDLGAGIGFRI